MNRRTLLSTIAAATSAGLAGCSAVDSGDDKAGGQPTKTLTASGEKAARRLSFGETLDLPRVAVTVNEPTATKTYRWSEGGEENVARAGDGKQWVVVRVRTENTLDRRVRLPLTENFKGVVGDRVYHPGRNKSSSEKYIGGKVDPGVTREGDVAYLTGADVPAEKFRVLYKERRPSGKRRVWWQ